MPLHPIAQEILSVVNGQPPAESIGVDAARLRSRAMTARAPRGPEVFSVRDDTARCDDVDLPVRIYSPGGPGPFPVVVYFHGGGFVLGDLETGDAHCRLFCAGADCVVVSVNYRHAPEARFPVPVQDAYAATSWVARNLDSLRGDARRIAVAGASAGASLAIATTLIARDRAGIQAARGRALPIAYQLLMVPGTDMRHDYESYRANAEGFGLNRETMRWFGRQYFADAADLEHPHASPLRAPSLAGLPPATILTAEYDPLRDEGAAYAAALRAAGVPVRHRDYTGFIHLQLGPQADEDMIADLRSAFTVCQLPWP
jgi:acetyl esterase